MKKDLILIGGGGHCSSVIDVIEQQNVFSVCGIIDIEEKLGKKVLGYPIIGTDEQIEEFAKKYKHFHVSIGWINSPVRRIEIFKKLVNLNVNLPVIVSPNAYLSKHASINRGSIVMHNAQINAGALIGANCIINSKSLIEHDAIIEDDCHISTGAIINGGVKVGKQTFIGSGAVTKQYIEIPENSFIKANSLKYE